MSTFHANSANAGSSALGRSSTFTASTRNDAPPWKQGRSHHRNMWSGQNRRTGSRRSAPAASGRSGRGRACGRDGPAARAHDRALRLVVGLRRLELRAHTDRPCAEHLLAAGDGLVDAADAGEDRRAVERDQRSGVLDRCAVRGTQLTVRRSMFAPRARCEPTGSKPRRRCCLRVSAACFSVGSVRSGA